MTVFYNKYIILYSVMGRQFILSLVLVLVIVSSGFSQTAIRLSPPHEKSLQVSPPVLQLDRNNGVHVSWIQPKVGTGTGQILFTYSSDGKNFGSLFGVNTTSDALADYGRTSNFTIDSRGYIHVVWVSQRFQTTQTDIWYAWSFDHGKNWSIPMSVIDDDDSTNYYQDFPSIACDSNNNIYVAFIDYRETERHKTPYPNVYFTRSTDAGTSWSKNKKVDSISGPRSGGASEASTPKIQASADGHIYIAYRANVKDDRTVMLARSYDGGITFMPSLPIQRAPWILSQCPRSAPSLALDENETAHIVWRDARMNFESHLYYASVPNGSIDSPQNVRLENPIDLTAENPDISVYDRGKARLISYQTSKGPCYYQLYEDLKPEVSRVLFPAGKQQIWPSGRFGSDGSKHLLWLDSKLGAGYDVFYAKDTISLLLDVQPDPAPVSSILAIKNNPAMDHTIVSIDEELVSFTLTDLLGKTIPIAFSQESLTAYRLDLRLVRRGAYILSALSASGTFVTAKLTVLR